MQGGVKLMADADAASGIRAATLSLPPRDAEFVRKVIHAARQGKLGDLTQLPNRLRDPGRLRREVDTLRGLLEIVDGGAVAVDELMLSALREMA
jgi:hypothetical protein